MYVYNCGHSLIIALLYKIKKSLVDGRIQTLLTVHKKYSTNDHNNFLVLFNKIYKHKYRFN